MPTIHVPLGVGTESAIMEEGIVPLGCFDDFRAFALYGPAPVGNLSTKSFSNFTSYNVRRTYAHRQVKANYEC